MKFRIIIISCLMSLILFAGCNEEQLQQVDQFVQDVNNVTTGGQAVMDSPAGGAIPEPANSIVTLALLLASAGVNIYQKWRNTITAKKYASMKAGQAQLTLENPEAGQQLYKMVGVERAANGL